MLVRNDCANEGRGFLAGQQAHLARVFIFRVWAFMALAGLRSPIREMLSVSCIPKGGTCVRRTAPPLRPWIRSPTMRGLR